MMEQEHENPSNGKASADLDECFSGESPDEFDSTCSTPYVSAPSSPGRGTAGGYFFSAPASPMHYILSSAPYSVSSSPIAGDNSVVAGSFEFEFSSRYPSVASTGTVGSMTSADELFLNGQIRPMKLSSHLQRPQILAPLLDVDEENENARDMGDSAERGRDLRMRSRSIHRRTRSMSPLRNAGRFQWQEEEDAGEKNDVKEEGTELQKGADTLTPSESASSSRSSSSGRSSKRWVFLKDLLYRSKSEGRANAKEKFWHSISFTPSKEKSKLPPPIPCSPSNSLCQNSSSETCQKQRKQNGRKPGSSNAAVAPPRSSNGVGKRRTPAQSAHERLYTSNRAQMEEMRKRTFLPYRQGLLGCLGFSSRSYGAMNGLAKSLNPVSSRNS